MLFSLIQLALLVLGLAGVLILFLGVKRELHKQALNNHARIAEVLARLRDAERPAPEPLSEQAPAPLGVRSGLNLNKRIQALRLHRRGEDVGHIAAALGIPRSEVELMVRVHLMSAKRASRFA
jgi:hypothetical protein